MCWQESTHSLKPRCRKILLVIVGLAVAVSIGTFGVASRRAAQDEERRRDAKWRLEAILEGLRNSDAFWNRLPYAIERNDAGDPTHSWRFLACRDTFGDTVQYGYYGQDAQAAYTEPWNSAGNVGITKDRTGDIWAAHHLSLTQPDPGTKLALSRLLVLALHFRQAIRFE